MMVCPLRWGFNGCSLFMFLIISTLNNYSEWLRCTELMVYTDALSGGESKIIYNEIHIFLRDNSLFYGL